MAGSPEEIALLGLPQIRTCGFPASGSSRHNLATAMVHRVDRYRWRERVTLQEPSEPIPGDHPVAVSPREALPSETDRRPPETRLSLCETTSNATGTAPAYVHNVLASTRWHFAALRMRNEANPQFRNLRNEANFRRVGVRIEANLGD